MKKLWIPLAILAVAAIVFFFVQGRRGEMVAAAELDAKIVQPYIRAAAEGDYRQAYDLLCDEYHRDVPFEKFQQAHEKRKREAGTVRHAKPIHDQTLHNLFSSKRTVHLGYEVDYGSGPQTLWVILEEIDDNRFAIEGTYKQGASETFDFMVW